ncbi:MAG: hypothetical protein JRI68_05065 [Deltaproteobacteria bacterium]|nr:hypothetical protein [Deltaproteobacteria bacterium]
MHMRTLIPVGGLLSLLVACGGKTSVFDDGNGGAGGSSSSSTSSNGSTSTSTSSTSSSGTQTICTDSLECELVSETCCGVCGMPSLEDMVALHEDDVEAHFQDVCAEPIGCPDCPSAPNPHLFAYCDAGLCKGAAVTDDPQGSCQDNTDCKLRMGLDCCECGSQGPITAIPVAYEPKLQELVCDGDYGCPECAPVYPSGAEAWCEQGECIVIYLDAPSGS